MLLWLLPTVAVFAFVLTGMLRRYALSRSIIDIPNHRSSHTVPTPRGGGVAIVFCFLASLFFLAGVGEITCSLTVALVGSGSAIAVLGFLDDKGHIAARWRLLGHFVAAAWGVFWLGGAPLFYAFEITINTGMLGAVVVTFYLVWMLNLYNFMDGIDGIASVEAISVCFGVSLIYWLTDYQFLIAPPLVLALSVCGFLYWNFPPARIFMGDAGSGFLGITLGVLSLHAGWVAPKLFWVWLILLGVFICDATVTLLRRLLRGDKVYEAHRTHAYQYASRYYGKHLPVTLSVMLINILWLLPIAICVAVLGLGGVVGIVIAYLPLLLLSLKFKAGAVEKT